VKVRSASVAEETIAQPETGNALRSEHTSGAGAHRRVTPVGVAPASIVRASGVFPSRALVSHLSATSPLSLSVFLSGEAHVPSRPRVLRTYVHTRSRTADLSFPTPSTSSRRPIGPYPAQKHRTARPSVQRKRGESARAGRCGARRNEKIVQN
jgi:hypothetical protein